MNCAGRPIQMMQMVCFIVAAWSVFIPRGVIGVAGCASASCPAECDPCEEAADAFEAEFLCRVRRLRSLLRPRLTLPIRLRRPVPAVPHGFFSRHMGLPIACRVLPGMQAPLLQ